MHKNFLFNNLEELMNYSNNYKGSDPLVKLPNIIVQNLNNSINLNKCETEAIRFLATDYDKKLAKFPIKYLINIEDKAVKYHFLVMIILYFYSKGINNFIILGRENDFEEYRKMLVNNLSISYLFAYKIQFMGKLIDIKEISNLSLFSNKESINLIFSNHNNFLSKYENIESDKKFLIINNIDSIADLNKYKKFNIFHIFEHFNFDQSSYEKDMLDNFIYNYDKNKMQKVNNTSTKELQLCALKDSFKQSNLFKNGFIFLNKKEKLDKQIKIFPDEISKNITHTIGEISSKYIYSKTYKLSSIDLELIYKYAKNYREFNLEYLRSKFNNVDSTLDLFKLDEYFGNNKVEVCFNDENDFNHSLKYSINIALSNIATYVHKFNPVYNGSNKFLAHPIQKVFDLTDIYIDQYSYKTDLSGENWFTCKCDSFTHQQYQFINYFKSNIVSKLNEKGLKFWLVKNHFQNKANIYSFTNAIKIIPDFYLFIEGKNKNYQVLIETKENSKWMNDYWHEDFFASLNKMIPVKENNITYQMYALPLANFDINSGEFSKKFDELINVVD
ncbi:restriction endonuclease subunit R [Mycoplasma bovis]|nr:restriction endonuclease subunit R [Mycoplasmopsis bovis]